MTDQEKTEQLEKIVASIAETLKPEVIRIEAGMMATQNHYDKYLALISQLQGALGDDLETSRKVLRLALFRAGANQAGVNNALALF